MENDPEMLEAFSQEILEIKSELHPISEALKVQYNQPTLFEKFGQVIDRVYGTAATLGYKEVAAYCRAIKSVTYKCSQSNNMYAMGQVKELCTVAYAMLERFSSLIKNPNEVKKIQYLMQKECEKAETLSKKLFSTIARASVK